MCWTRSPNWARPPSSTSSTAPASRSIRPATRCACSPASSTTSLWRYRKWWKRLGGSPPPGRTWTGGRSRYGLLAHPRRFRWRCGPSASTSAGARGAAWLKVKPAHTLDLVVLAAEWGHGRRRGRLSNLHVGARDPDAGGFVMLGKTFKGMTDEMLAWQTTHLLELATKRDRFTVYVRPELVVEVAFDGIQASRQYPGGLTLRFARVKRYRPDKGPDAVDTIAAVRALHAGC